MDTRRAAAGGFRVASDGIGSYARLPEPAKDADAADDDEPRAWIGVFWEAVAFMWPDSVWLQVWIMRTQGCQPWYVD
eukprot:352761-Chlamydomonas_euryale.AAC.3